MFTAWLWFQHGDGHVLVKGSCMGRRHAGAMPVDLCTRRNGHACREGRCAWKLGVKGFGSSPAEVGPGCARELLPSLSPGVSGKRHLLVARMPVTATPRQMMRLLIGRQLGDVIELKCHAAVQGGKLPLHLVGRLSADTPRRCMTAGGYGASRARSPAIMRLLAASSSAVARSRAAVPAAEASYAARAAAAAVGTDCRCSSPQVLMQTTANKHLLCASASGSKLTAAKVLPAASSTLLEVDTKVTRTPHLLWTR